MSSDNAWETVSYDGLSVRLRTGTVERRAMLGKHQGADAMTTDEARTVIEKPHIIQESTTEPRRSYYRYQAEVGKPPYMRTTVAIQHDDNADVISWGRQRSLPKHETPIMVNWRLG